MLVGSWASELPSIVRCLSKIGPDPAVGESGVEMEIAAQGAQTGQIREGQLGAELGLGLKGRSGDQPSDENLPAGASPRQSTT